MKPAYKNKICDLCGKEFTPKSGKAKYCMQKITRICLVCGNSFISTCHPKANEVCDNPDCKRRAGFVASVTAGLKLCRVCKQPFTPASSRQLDCGRPIEKICEICGTTYKSRCGLRWQAHTCNSNSCRAQYAHKQQSAHFLAITRKCSWCRKEFNPVNNKQELCGNSHNMICRTCGKSYEVDPKYSKTTAPQFCSDECRTAGYIPHKQTPESLEKTKRTKIQKYGEDYGVKILEKGRQTYQERTGYSHPIYNLATHYKRAKTRKNIAAKDGKHFDSDYERQVYNFLLDIPNLHIDTQIPIDLDCNEAEHKTWVDFKIDDRLFEAKGEHLLSGVYDSAGIPIAIKLEAYNSNNVIVITNNTVKTRSILVQYPNIIGIDILLFDNSLLKEDKIERWKKIKRAINQKNKFIEESSI